MSIHLQMTLLSTSFFKRVKVVSKQASAAIMLQMKPIIHENKPPVVCFLPSGKDLGITAAFHVCPPFLTGRNTISFNSDTGTR